MSLFNYTCSQQVNPDQQVPAFQARLVPRQTAISIVGRVFASGDGIVWKIDSPPLPRFLVGVVLQVHLRIVASDHVAFRTSEFGAAAIMDLESARAVS
jgi:hypothetical protein